MAVPSNPEVVTALNASVAKHLQEIEINRNLAAFYGRHGFPKLAAHFAEDVGYEGEHLARLLGRLGFLDAAPDYTHEPPFAPGAVGEVASVFTSLLAVIESSSEVERAGILTAVEAGDEGTAEVFRENLKGSEGASLEVRGFLDAIAAVTPQNWLANWT